MRSSRTRVARGSWRMWGAVVVVLAVSGQAHAFYWFGWPGSQVVAEQTLVPPPVVTNPPNGLPPHAPGTPEQPVGPPVPVDKTPIGPPEHTPEPSTGLIGLIGLGALAVRRWAKKKD